MGRPARRAIGDFIYHVRHRAVGGSTLFRTEAEYLAFEGILRRSAGFTGVRLLAYCLMPDHWHLVIWPGPGGDLSRYVGWVAAAHRRRARRQGARAGPLYRGRFRSFPVREGPPLWAVGRYAERNPVRSGLVTAAEGWRWSSLWHEVRGRPDWLSEWPRGRPPLVIWQEWVNRPEPAATLAELRRCAERGSPYGDAAWVRETAERLGLQSTLRPRGRPPKAKRAAPPAAPRGSGRPVRGVNLFTAEEWVQRKAGRPGEPPGDPPGSPG